MAGDPIAVIVAVIVGAAGAVAGMDAPPPVKDSAADIAASAQDQSPGLKDQLQGLLDTLPADARDAAGTTLDTAATALEDAAEPMLPGLSEDLAEQQQLDAADASTAVAASTAAAAAVASTAASSIATTAVQTTAVPTSAVPTSAFPASAFPSNAFQFGSFSYPLEQIRDQTAFMASAEAVRRALFPGVPATFTGVSLNPVGAITAFVPWLTKAGGICGGVTAPTIAALYAAENGFRFGPTAPVSSTGAQGPGQFMPGTWKTYGKDADGDGRVDINSIADSVMASGNLLCDINKQVEGWKTAGLVKGDSLDLTLAGYNAGAGAVLKSGGMPSGTPDYENQTKPYVAKIRATERQFAALLTPFAGLNLAGIGGRAVQSAMDYLGLPYVWGGGNINGPSGGGFDCSGLTSYAVFKASGGAITLPRTSETQWNVGTEIPLTMAQPGDLLFGNWQSGGPGHVAIYIGNGQMVHAPTTGDVVRVAPVFDGMKARRIL